jgi:alpha-glucosidase
VTPTHRFLLLLALTACSGPTERATGWTLTGPGIRVEITGTPYRFVVRDHAGALVLESLPSASGTGGYNSIAYARGSFGLINLVSPGYFRVESNLEPWQDGLRVVEADLDETGGTLDLTLAGDGPERVVVRHAVGDGRLRVEARLEGGAAPRAWSAAFRSPATEGFLGLGERFTRTNFRGLSMYSWVEEGGLGSNEGEAPGPVNPWPNGEPMAYYPVPFFLSTSGYGAWIDTTYYNRFDLATAARADAWRLFSISPTLAYEIFVPRAGDPRPWPYHIIDRFTERTGRPMVPPAWTFGPRRRINHGDRQGDVSEIQAMRDLDLAITAMDDAFHYLPNGAPPDRLAELPAQIAEARRLGYRVNGYFNSFFSLNPDDPVAADTRFGLEQGYFLKKPGGEVAESWIITGGSTVTMYVLDFTSAAATAWYTGLFQRALDAGHVGWMYDFGEYVPFDAVAASGMKGEELHNLYPVLYQKAAYERLEASSLRGDWLTFVRSGYTGASRWSPMVWAGDPAASFESSDGLPSMVRAGINIGVSGVPNWGGDIGGFHCVADGGEKADGELLTRWIQQGALTPNMQDQDACVGGDRNLKATIFSSPDAQAAWRTYARLHTRLQPYFLTAAHEASRTGAPIIRHVFLENPGRPEWAGVDDVYYLGSALLVAPVVARGAREKRLDLPAGRWLDWDTRAVLDGGRQVTLDAPLARMPILLREGHLVPLLDARIDTLATEDHPDVVGPADVADVYDVVGFVTRGAARFDLWDGGWIEAVLEGEVAPPAFAEARDEAELQTCGACWRIDALDGGARRVRVSVDLANAPITQAGGLTLRAYAGRRVRWDLVVLL